MSALPITIGSLLGTPLVLALGDLADERVRERLNRLAYWIVRRAALRVPVELRDDLAEEWSAELAAVLRGARALPILRLARAIPYALGLLRSGPSIGHALMTALEHQPAESPPDTGADTAPDPSPTRLLPLESALLAFERQYWKYSSAKEQAIRERLNMSATRYYHLLNTLLDQDDALEFDPVLVKRLRRLRAARSRARGARRAHPGEGRG